MKQDLTNLRDLVSVITGAKCYLVDEEIHCKPEMISMSFMKKLLDSLINSNFIFLVNRDLTVIIFKP